MTDKLNRLTNDPGKFTIRDIIKISKQYYKSATGDDKKARSKLDIKSAKITARKNYTYDPSEKRWIQTGRDVLLSFIVSSQPISYKKTDTINTHKYPVFFLIHDVEKGIDSTFKWREGGLKKPIFAKQGLSSVQVANANIRNGTQLQFFFDSEFALKKHNLLYGRCWANRPPTKTNPKMIPFFGKHAWTICSSILIRMLGVDGGIVKKYITKEGTKIN
jgi:hypothetical protein